MGVVPSIKFAVMTLNNNKAHYIYKVVYLFHVIAKVVVRSLSYPVELLGGAFPSGPGRRLLPPWRIFPWSLVLGSRAWAYNGLVRYMFLLRFVQVEARGCEYDKGVRTVRMLCLLLSEYSDPHIGLLIMLFNRAVKLSLI